MKWRGLPALALLLLAFAVLASIANADTIVRGFKANGTLEPGIIVALSGNSNDAVDIATEKDPTKIYGVVIDPAQAPFTVQKSGQQVFVATGGSYPTLVSTQNGTIKAISAIIALSVLLVGVKSSITAIGRNPLSKKSILTGLFQVITVAILVFIVGMFGVYLLLRL
jgi:hypothetical protein